MEILIKIVPPIKGVLMLRVFSKKRKNYCGRFLYLLFII